METKTNKTKTETQATWRAKLKAHQELKAYLLMQWGEHNRFHIEKQSDGGFRVRLESTPQGDLITAEIAEYCGLDKDTVVQKMVGEVLTELGGKWIPNKLKGGQRNESVQ